ncbi:MAG: hypothetical protein ABR609_08755 [Acidimicrobiia bacterium]
MASANDASVVAHTDVSDLFAPNQGHWALFECGIGINLNVWKGRVAELQPIRHRNAHCRPHVDDADRIEQLLRDLEGGADRALRAYVRFRDPLSNLKDPIVDAWGRGTHPVAARLLDHGANNKGIHFGLQFSKRPWADMSGLATLTGVRGVYWAMAVQLEYDHRHIFLDDYWADYGVQASLPFIGHIIQPADTVLYVTFPAVGAPGEIADAIGRCFEAVFSASRASRGDGSVRRSWRRPTGPDFDPRVDAEGLLSILTGLNDDDPITFFGATGRR